MIVKGRLSGGRLKERPCKLRKSHQIYGGVESGGPVLYISRPAIRIRLKAVTMTGRYSCS